MENGNLCALKQSAYAVGAVAIVASISKVDPHKAARRHGLLGVDDAPVDCGSVT